MAEARKASEIMGDEVSFGYGICSEKRMAVSCRGYRWFVHEVSDAVKFHFRRGEGKERTKCEDGSERVISPRRI